MACPLVMLADEREHDLNFRGRGRSQAAWEPDVPLPGAQPPLQVRPCVFRVVLFRSCCSDVDLCAPAIVQGFHSPCTPVWMDSDVRHHSC